MYALILSGGRGSRLRPITDSIPKPMAPLCGKPILWHQTQWLISNGVTDIIFLAGYRWQVIQEYFGDGSSYGFRAIYSVEKTPLGRGGAVRKGMALVPRDQESVIVTNGDVVTSENLNDFVGVFRRQREDNPAHQATIMVVPFPSSYGLVDLNRRGIVKGFREKVLLPYWINGGIYVFAREMEDMLPLKGDHETLTLPSLAAEGKLGAFRSKAFWRSVDSFKDLEEAEEYLKENKR